MSRRRWVIGLGPPAPRIAGVAFLLAALLVGCAGVRPTASPGASTPAASSEPPASSRRPIGGPPQGRDLVGKTWLAEGPRGWEAGQIGGPRVRLGRDEVGIAAQGRWIISAVLRPIESIRMFVREGPGAKPTEIALGSLAPTATVIVGDRAYVSGFVVGRPDDPGILEVDLATAASRALLPPSATVGMRYLAASPDGSTLVSTLCDLASDPEPATCSLTVVSLSDGSATVLDDVAGGLLRGTSSAVAVVAPQGPEPPGWLAGIDLQTGRELWRLTGGEFGQSFMHVERGLIQQRLRIGGPKPRLVIEAIDVRSGTSEVLYEESRDIPRALWPALSSDTSIALGEDATGSRAIARGDDAQARIRLVPIDGGNPVDLDVSLRSEP